MEKTFVMAQKDDLANIIAGCASGSEQSFSELLELYSDRCYGYFYRLSGNRTISEDLLSQLFVKLVTKIRTFKGGSFDGWVFKIAANIFRDYLRAKGRQKKLFERQKEEFDDPKATFRKDDDERIDQLQVELNKLDADTKEAIMLRYYSDLSFKEIAGIRKEPIGTTLSKVHRGLKRLKELLG